MINPQVLTFIAVAKHGSFSRAAEALYISPTAVMKQIDVLEKRLDVSLFKRINHGLVLTEAGASVLTDAKYLADYAARAEEKAREIGKKENIRAIRIGTSVMTPAKFILDIWSEIQNVAPNLKVELIPFENTPENAREILSNLGVQIDVVAGIYDDNFKEERGFQTVRLEDKKICFAFPLTSPLAAKRSVSPEDLKQTGVMFIKKGWNKYIDELRTTFEKADVKITDFDFFNLAAFNEAVKKNIPIIAISGWESIHPLLKIVASKTTVSVPYGIMYSTNPSNHVNQFIKAVESVVSGNNGK